MLRHYLPASIRQTLDQLPESLDETYARVLRQIPKANQAHAHRMLQCIMVAVRPLHVEELAEVLAFDFDTAQGAVPRYRAGWQLNEQEQAVLSTCSSLIAVVDIYGWQFVQFSHFSVKEFLMSDRLTSSLGDFSRYQILPGPAHTILAQACLGCLLHLDDLVDEVSLEGFQLAEYAAEHWVTHAQFEGVVSHMKDGMESLFDCDKPHFTTWVEIYNIDEPYQPYWSLTSNTPSPLYYTALCGFHDLVEYLAIKHPQHVNAIGGRYEFPLHAALVRKHVQVVEILLKHGANVDIQGRGGRTPLHETIKDVGMVQLLLNHGADVNSRRDDLRTPLHLAACYGELDIARVLLEHKPDIDSRDKWGETPLHIVSRVNYLSRSQEHRIGFARLLLERGVDVNAMDKGHRTPLHHASYFGRPEIARVLLDYVANANVKSKQGETPLHLVSRGKYDSHDHGVRVARMLLECGVDVNVPSKEGNTPLHFASYSRRLEITRMLLNHAAHANAENEQGETPLHLVSRGNYDSQEHGVGIARLLLERGVDVNARKKNNWTPLHSAAFTGNLEIASVLLDNGARANAENDQGETPLHLVSRGKYGSHELGVGVARMLLERGVDVNAPDKDHRTALHSASYFGDLEIARVLLDHGAKASWPSSEDDRAQTPLHLVFKNSYWFQHDGLGVAKLLLERGADINARDKDNATPLHLACYRGRFNIARALLDYDTKDHTENEGLEGGHSSHEQSFSDTLC